MKYGCHFETPAVSVPLSMRGMVSAPPRLRSVWLVSLSLPHVYALVPVRVCPLCVAEESMVSHLLGYSS